MSVGSQASLPCIHTLLTTINLCVVPISYAHIDYYLLKETENSLRLWMRSTDGQPACQEETFCSLSGCVAEMQGSVGQLETPPDLRCCFEIEFPEADPLFKQSNI